MQLKALKLSLRKPPFGSGDVSPGKAMKIYVRRKGTASWSDPSRKTIPIWNELNEGPNSAVSAFHCSSCPWPSFPGFFLDKDVNSRCFLHLCFSDRVVVRRQCPKAITFWPTLQISCLIHRPSRYPLHSLFQGQAFPKAPFHPGCSPNTSENPRGFLALWNSHLGQSLSFYGPCSCFLPAAEELCECLRCISISTYVPEKEATLLILKYLVNTWHTCQALWLVLRIQWWGKTDAVTTLRDITS